MNCNIIRLKYRKYKEVFKKSKEGYSLLYYSEDNYEIVFENLEKIRIKSLYNINEKIVINIIKVYRKEP